MRSHIDDLSFDLLKYIFGYLDDKQLFVIERVNRKWQKCILKLLEKKTDLKSLEYYTEKFRVESSGGANIIDDNNIGILKNILSKCNSIKHINLRETKVTPNNLIAIAKLCPKLESIDLSFTNFLGITKEEMEEFAKKIGPQLIKCHSKYYIYDDIFLKILFKHFKNIGEMNFSSGPTTSCKGLFHQLNRNCKNLKVLKFSTSYIHSIDYEDEDIKNVLQRIEHLTIDLATFSRFKFEMNNLKELTLKEYEVRGIIQMERKTFNNLIKLNVKSFSNLAYDSISKLSFPKLETVLLLKHHVDIPISFINQIKHINSLYYKGNDIVPSTFSQFNQLTNLVCKSIALYNNASILHLFQCFHTISMHKSLENIKFEIYDFNMLIDLHFFENLINFCKLKSNTKINIYIHVTEFISSETNENFINYKNLFDEMKHLYKLKVQLIYSAYNQM